MNQRPVSFVPARPRWVVALAPLCLAALWWACVPAAQAAGATAAPSLVGQVGADGVVTVRTYVTVAGDTPERVIQKTMADSPLKVEVLRQALVQANPQAIPAGRNPRLKAGTVLQLPDHGAVVRQVLMPLLPAADAAALSPDPAQERRRWVRFP